MRIGSLFSGIGGFELGLEAAGVGHVVFTAEREPFCQQVLALLYPEAVRFSDVEAITAATAPSVDLLCGGFPCQDISLAGTGAGLAGPRSSLWWQYARIIGELRPRYVCIENVPALLVRGGDEVLGSLAALGYDAFWDCLPASAIGAPHERDRLYMVAWAVSDAERDRVRLEPEPGPGAARAADRGHAEPEHVGSVAELGDADRARQPGAQPRTERAGLAALGAAGALDLADAAREREQAGREGSAVRGQVGSGSEHDGSGLADAAGGRGLADADRGRRQEERLASGQPADGSAPGHELDGSKLPFWPPAPDDLLAWDAVPAGAQPALCRMAAGAVPAVLGSARRRSRAELLRALGNAVVPEVAFVVGALVLELDRKLTVLGSRL